MLRSARTARLDSEEAWDARFHPDRACGCRGARRLGAIEALIDCRNPAQDDQRLRMAEERGNVRRAQSSRATVPWLAAPVVSLVLLAAHAFRAGSYVVVLLLLAVLALMVVRRRWAVRVVQIVLLLGAVEWFMTLAELAFWRAAAGQPFFRLIAILAPVALLTAASVFVFRAEALRRFYGISRVSSAGASDSPCSS